MAIGLIILSPRWFKQRKVLDIPQRPKSEFLTMQKTAGRIMGGFANRRFPEQNARIVILLPPDEVRDKTDSATLEGLLNSLSDRHEIIKETVPLPDQKEIIPTANLWFKPEGFDRAVSSHGDADLIISICGLPLRPNSLKFWHWSQAPPLALLNAQVYRLRKMFAKDFIVSALVRKPLPVSAEDLPSPDSEKNWLLITDRNVNEINKQYENMFKNDEE